MSNNKHFFVGGKMKKLVLVATIFALTLAYAGDPRTIYVSVHDMTDGLYDFSAPDSSIHLSVGLLKDQLKSLTNGVFQPLIVC